MRVLPPIVAAGGAAFIFYQWVGGRPFWVDEQMIALNIRDRSLAELAGPLWFGQSAPLGWLALQRTIALAAGTSEQALRFLPALFGAATLGAAAWIGRRWMSAAASLLFVTLCTFGLWLSFYPLEMKHYSADAFWGLVIPALAVWASEGTGAKAVRRRGIAWWVIAAVAHWFSNGGLLATPGCALVLFALIWKRFGAREALFFAMSGLVWLLSFAIYWQTCLRYTHHSPYLRKYWIGDFPPPAFGLSGRLGWLFDRLPAIAANPGGASLWVALFAASAAGFLLARPPALGLAFATAPLAMLLLAGTRLVPFFGRFALWVVPALYVGIALLADRGLSFARPAAPRRPVRLAAALASVALVLTTSFDIVAIGWDDFKTTRATSTNRGLDDRASTRWVMEQRREGDAILTTRLGWPAIWWYGTARPASRGSDLNVDYYPPGLSCDPEGLRKALLPYKRALVHIGFPDLPEGFGELLLRRLDEIGAIDKYQEFTSVGFVAIVALHTENAEQSSLSLIPRRQPRPVPLEGCISVEPAELW